MKFTRNLWLLALVAALTGCGGSSGTMMDDEGMSGDGADYGDMDSAQTLGAGDDGYGDGADFADGQISGEMLDSRIIYFDYDTADVDPQSLEVLVEHAHYLGANTDLQIRLEGHADERGSREYNIGLGERRAQAVKQILLLQGAATDQTSTVSYGEERPAALGSDDESMSLNRRVELVYAP